MATLSTWMRGGSLSTSTEGFPCSFLAAVTICMLKTATDQGQTTRQSQQRLLDRSCRHQRVSLLVVKPIMHRPVTFNVMGAALLAFRLRSGRSCRQRAQQRWSQTNQERMKRFVVRSYYREFSNGRSSRRLRPNLTTYIRILKTDMHLHAASQYYLLQQHQDQRCGTSTTSFDARNHHLQPASSSRKQNVLGKLQNYPIDGQRIKQRYRIPQV